MSRLTGLTLWTLCIARSPVAAQNWYSTFSTLGNLATIADTAVQLGSTFAQRQAAVRQQNGSNSTALFNRQVLNGKSFNKTSGANVQQLAHVLQSLKDCDPNTDGLCCVLPQYCDAQADCFSDVTADKLIEYVNAFPRCQCRAGFEGDGITRGSGCQNINECDLMPPKCDHLCKDFAPGYACGCRDGYRLGSDNIRCVDIDECLESTHSCSHFCSNVIGSYNCICPTGFVMGDDGRTCVDVDECALGYCQYTDLCVNDYGGYSCGCPSGYEPDSRDLRRCIDLDECAAGVYISVKEVVTISGKHSTVNDISSTIVAACPVLSTSCQNSESGFTCACQDGYIGHDGASFKGLGVGSPMTDDYFVALYRYNNVSSIEQRDQPSSFVGSYPVVTLGSDVSTDVMHDVYAYNELLRKASNMRCHDVDECSIFQDSPLNIDVCRSQTTIEHISRTTTNYINKSGSLELTCDTSDIISKAAWTKLSQAIASDNATDVLYKGFSSIDQQLQCVDTSDDVVPTCHNTIGSFDCLCFVGYTYNSNTKKCEDIDECAIGSHNCDVMSNMICYNLIGSYECRCGPGFITERSSQGESCVDIDECNSETPPCSHTCTNLEGSYICNCLDGYILDNDEVTCIDIDECSMGLCPSHCLNIRGGYICACAPGYIDASFIDGFLQSTTIWPNHILRLADTLTSADVSNEIMTTIYQTAATDLGAVCIDVDECTYEDVCPDNTTCRNTKGSFECDCIEGYRQTGIAGLQRRTRESYTSTYEQPIKHSQLRNSITPAEATRKIGSSHTSRLAFLNPWIGRSLIHQRKPYFEAHRRALQTSTQIETSWVDWHLDLDKYSSRTNFVACVDINECEEGINGNAPCSQFNRPCCQNLQGSFQCWKTNRGFGSDRQCPVIDGQRTEAYGRR